MLSRIGNGVVTAHVHRSEHISPSIWQLPDFVLVRLLIFTCIFSLYSDNELHISQKTGMSKE